MSPQTTLRVHLAEPEEEYDLPALRQALSDRIRLTVGADVPQDPGYHILIAGRPSAEHIRASEKLHTLIIPWAGLPPETRARMRKHRHIAVHNLHFNAPATAEMAIALLLAAAKHLLPIDHALRAGDWRPRHLPNPSMLLDGKSALVLGYGAIGSRVGRMCLAMGMRVLACRRNPEVNSSSPVEQHAHTSLDALLPQADVLQICLPLTPQTEGLIGARELGLLPEGAILVNTSRGDIVEEAALYQALKSGKLAGAGIDVWYRYPQDEAYRATTMPSDYPFQELENVVMSPHRGGGSKESAGRRTAALAELLNAAARGEPVPNKVDLQRGY